jgi:pre-rRNA-processing protein RIX1
MSLPPDLRVLCFQLSNTASHDLPRLTPTLLQCLARCQLPLSSPAGSSSGAGASTSSVPVHKLKTQLSSLLKGQSTEGRFAAVSLMKTFIEVGGWEVLQGPELKGFWVPGLLSILVVSKISEFKFKDLPVHRNRIALPQRSCAY